MSQLLPGATGGFTTRADRNDVLVAPVTTGEEVGPGTYLGHGSYTPLPAPVPFHTSAERVLVENNNTSAITPGPGAYEAAQAADILRHKTAQSLASSSCFAQGVPRLPDDEKERAPGPGQYQVGPRWIKQGPRYQAPPPPQKVNFTRAPSAPSIPGRHQSYGYEEQEGKLIMQRSPERVRTGSKMDTAGPGDYDGAAAVVQGHSKAPTWSHSRSNREARYGSIAPGPGAYNLKRDLLKQGAGAMTISIGGMEVVLGGNHGTSSFASRAPRPLQKQPTVHETTPGPGAYQAEEAALTVRRTGVIAAIPGVTSAVFGSQGVRGYVPDPTKTRSAPTYWRTPGPGAYEDSRASVNKHTGGKSGLLAAQMTSPETHQFSSAASRFGKSENGVPGPGEYKPDQVITLVKEVERKNAIIRPLGAFSTTGDRFGRRTAADPTGAAMGLPGAAADMGVTPGPGNYDPRLPSRPRPKGDTTSPFVSRTHRFRPTTAPPAAPDPMTADGVNPPRGDPAALGPGCYETKDTWNKDRRTHRPVAFGSETQRAKMAAPSITPGPGRYNNHAVDVNAVFKPVTLPSDTAAFGAQNARFKKGHNYTPGPGTYLGHDDLARRSYNITFHQHGVQGA